MDNIQYIDYPWKYAVVDNFLPQDTFTQLIDYCKNEGVDTLSPTTYSEGLKDKELQNNILIKCQELFNFTYKILDTENKITNFLGPYFHLQFREPGHNYNIHTDVEGKLYTIVLYIYPEASDGTPLYTSGEPEYVGDLEWRPNRAMAFCPIQTKGKETFHAVKNTTTQNRAALVINYLKK